MTVDVNEVMRNKRVLQWKAWFVNETDDLMRFESTKTNYRDLPEDGFICGKLMLVDGTFENVEGGGYLIVMETPNGLLFQNTGSEMRPEEARYPNAKIIRDKLCSSATNTLAHEEQQNASWEVISVAHAVGKAFAR